MSKIKVIKRGMKTDGAATHLTTAIPIKPQQAHIRDIESTVESWIKEYRQTKDQATQRALSYLGGK